MSARPASAQRKTTAEARRDAILAAMPKEDFDALAAALARLLLSAARVNGRAATASERTTDQEAVS
jgi:CRP-like cAMP-binding protein